MNKASKRIYLYWALLLIPTLLVGAGALFLLRREQDRLASQATKIDEAQRSSLQARAQVAAENADLIVGDAQMGLIDVLAAGRPPGLVAYLDRLERANPLVKLTFLSDPNGDLVRPGDDELDDNLRAFRKRFSELLRDGIPWRTESKARQSIMFESSSGAKEQQVTKKSAEAPAAAAVPRKSASSSYADSVQQARRDVQALNTIPSAPVSQAKRQQEQEPLLERKAEQSRIQESEDTIVLNAFCVSDNPPKAISAGRDVQALNTIPSASVSQAKRQQEQEALMERKAERSRPQELQEMVVLDAFPVTAVPPQAKGASSAAPAASAAQEAGAPSAGSALAKDGWLAKTIDKRLVVIGWMQPEPAGAVRGFELEIPALVARLGASLPTGLPSGEGLCLRDERGRILHQSGQVDRGVVSIGRIPLKQDVLPGWVVEAYLQPKAFAENGSGAFMLVSSLVVGAFVIAILSGGSLLLWQARRSALEAVQKTSFVSNVSHELKTPLTSIRLYTELLEQKRVANEEKRGEYLRIIVRETERLTRLVNNVLDFSRLEQGRKPIRCEPIDLHAELDRVVLMLGAHAAEAGLKLDCDMPEGPVVASADRDAFGQILINLADNAVKYASEGGELRLVLRQVPPDRVELRVMDRGPGVPAEERERIFQKFHRLDESLTAEKGGAGLGLSIARQLARAMGGELSCLSREGGGAEFLLVLKGERT